ncbi:hypothetical protein [Loigolactobacillus backii]|uniref:Uncharacterized protein n=1 Tax=Loigolactobacillus backii TaxID=375175 RepID=A0A192H346_9LACO|nr:hypothetical protein [Loigolactobacillus backii]ANK59901.1 hypothetical protein AYR52_06280 [Loigolactobacillus backii]ANK63239.1 hypothetical protein AYR53_10960 [Loigolactobacillus backii]ANK64835.1 hypothetical protein AYR54_05965 [Loigolactobacillus backii]ANK66718.1 hypothetical protein AYR55_02790 [Loigolactobacillus backii]ANK69755.1 hypothetical protein AYR56_06045 [Loigolactobacillus backii]
MRIVQRVFASLLYHRKYAGTLGIVTALFLVLGLSCLIIKDFQRSALNLFQVRLGMIDQHAANISKFPALRQIILVHETLMKNEQTIFVILLWALALIILVASTVSLIHRRSELIAYRLAGKNFTTISWQFALENVALFLLIYFVVVTLLLCLQTPFMALLERLNQRLFIDSLSTALTNLKDSPTAAGWDNLNRIFSNQVTPFNGHLLLFGGADLSSDFLTDYSQYFASILWRGGSIVFTASYLPALLYNWHISRTIFE